MTMAMAIDIEDDLDVTIDAINTEDMQVIPAENKPDKDAIPKQQSIRTNFNETAFFYPSLLTDEEGNIKLKFTLPESLTTWKLLGLAHTKDLKTSLFEKEIVAQKKLMVFPNMPRFVRENDTIIISCKISNLHDDELKGNITIDFKNPVNREKLAIANDENKEFVIAHESDNTVEWEIIIPEGIQVFETTIQANTNEFSDGERHIIPVLSSKILVTETLPISIRGKQERTFNFESLKNSKDSKTLQHHKLTLEYTSNPIWYAIQALPYLDEQDSDCSEAVFSKFFANTLAKNIVDNNPQIEKIFKIWSTLDSDAFLSNLEKNPELKSTLLDATPWLLDAKEESANKKKIANLFNSNKINSELQYTISKLHDLQLQNGSWPWYSGMYESRFITQHIVSGLGHLQHLNVINSKNEHQLFRMLEKAIVYLDNEIEDDYNRLKKIKNIDLSKDHISPFQIQYLYLRSFFTEIDIPKTSIEAIDYYKNQSKKYWLKKGKYQQAQIALFLNREGDKIIPQKILKSLKEFANYSDEMGMYWKENYQSCYWHNAPIETHALMIELFNDVAQDEKSVNELKIWLLKHKQTNHWPTTKSTTEAIYSLLLNNKNIIVDPDVTITIGNEELNLKNEITEPGTGYFKTSWDKTQVSENMGNLKVNNNLDNVSWGGVYWQYFEEIDKLKSHNTNLSITKEIYRESLTSSGPVLSIITDNNLELGDKVTVRLIIESDRDMEFVHIKDMRATGFEPTIVLSGYRYNGKVGYYQSTKDASMNFYIHRLPKGKFVIKYQEKVNQKGSYSSGIATIQSMYAPEFSAHSKSKRVVVGE